MSSAALLSVLNIAKVIVIFIYMNEEENRSEQQD
jgi:hypothetical protein